MERFNPRARSDQYGSRLNRSHSTILAIIVPWASIMLASLVPIFVIATGIPITPPLGLLMMLAWRLVRPGLLPMWAGLPLGLFDDLFSGHVFGSGVLFFSLSMIAIEAMEARFPWSNFFQDWLTASLIVVVYILFAMILSGAQLSFELLSALGPQVLLSILVFPFLSRIVSRFDRMRLLRWRVVN